MRWIHPSGSDRHDGTKPWTNVACYKVNFWLVVKGSQARQHIIKPCKFVCNSAIGGCSGVLYDVNAALVVERFVEKRGMPCMSTFCQGLSM